MLMLIEWMAHYFHESFFFWTKEVRFCKQLFEISLIRVHCGRIWHNLYIFRCCLVIETTKKLKHLKEKC